ncbi:MAG: hypothetical protein JXR07_07050 [Reichenbachiella sp.]
MRIHLLVALSFAFLITISPAFSQGPGGGPRMSPSEMAEREKQYLFKEITDLSEDQKFLLNDVYKEFATTIDELRSEMRKNRDFQGMRSKMTALQNEKDGIIADILNEKQMEIYQGLVDKKRKERKERLQSRENQKVN